MATPLRILIVEDSEDDALLLIRVLRKGGYEPIFRRVDTLPAMEDALKREWDLIVADWHMPEFSGLDAFRAARDHGRDVPFIIVSGQIGEETAVRAMKAGVQDYLIKGNLSRLIPAIERELRDAVVRRDRRRVAEELAKSEEHYRTLFANTPVSIWESDFSRVMARLDELKAAGVKNIKKHLDRYPEITRECFALLRILEINPATLPLVGAETKEQVLKNLDHIFLKETMEVFNGQLSAAAKGETTHEGETTLKTLSGEIRHVYSRWTLICDEQQNSCKSTVSIVDITPLKQAEQQLRESRQRLELALAGADLGTWDWDLRNNTISFDRHWTDLLGVPPIGTRSDPSMWQDALHPEDRPRVLKTFENHIKGRTPAFEVEYRVRTRDGKWKWILDRGKVVERDENGKPIRAAGTYLDTTERRETRQALQTAEQRFALFMQHLPAHAYIKDAGGRYRYFNDYVGSALGINSQDIVGKTDESFWPPEIARQIQEDDSLVISTSQSLQKIEDFVLNGRDLSLLTYKFAIPQEDGSALLGGISLDITNRREAEKAVEESERRLREAQRIALVGDWEYDPKTGQFSWSEQLFNLFERDPEVGAPGLDETLSYYSPESQTMVREYIERLESEKDRKEMDLRAELPSGHPAYHFVVVNTVRGKDGRVAKATGTIQDITARKEAEEQLRQTSEQLDIERRALESKNIALREVLAQIEAEKEQLKQQFATNVEEAILPTLIRLKESSPPAQRRNFELLETELREVSSPFLNKIKNQFSKLSPRELEVCRLIKNGLTSKEIAESLNLSPATVQKHRELIRRKLGLVNDGVNLQSFLKSM